MNPATTVSTKVSSAPNLARIVDPRPLAALSSASRAPKEGDTGEDERTNERVDATDDAPNASSPFPFARARAEARHATETRARVGRTR